MPELKKFDMTKFVGYEGDIDAIPYLDKIREKSRISKQSIVKVVKVRKPKSISWSETREGKERREERREKRERRRVAGSKIVKAAVDVGAWKEKVLERKGAV